LIVTGSPHDEGAEPAAKARLQDTLRELEDLDREVDQLTERLKLLRRRQSQLRGQRERLIREVSGRPPTLPKPPHVSAEKYFDAVIGWVTDVAKEGDADRAALLLMARLREHPGTNGLLNSDLQGELLLTVMREGPDGVIQFVTNLPRPAQGKETDDRARDQG
jgi:hypothetical protein